LIVDDSEVVRVMVRRGAEAWDAYVDDPPDAVIIDMALPDATGLELAERLKEYDAALRFVMCTSSALDEVVEAALELGARDFVIKPFQPDRIIQAMKKAVEE
jgi:two-component system chemotaxis response regulator CheY